VAELIHKVNQSGGIDYAEQKMKEYQDKALAILGNFPRNEYYNSLEQLVIFSTQRKH
jgi:octaprenyl-diphosphate synthase